MENSNVLRGTIDDYINLLVKWNNKINLVSYTDLEELYQRHINDSLQLLSYIKPEEEVYDIGSGAGFPGLMLSYGGIKKVNLVDCNSKKVSFLLLAAALSTNKVHVHNKVIEEIETQNCDVITTRGFATLEKIFNTTKKFHKDNLKFILLKGKNYQEEIKKALDNWKFKCIIHQSVTSNDGFILEISDLKSK